VSNFNALARGLVSLLDATTAGRGPGTLTEILQGTIDLEPFFLLAKRERIATVAIPAGGSNTTWSGFGIANGFVPPNEAWLLNALTVRGTIPIGTRASITANVQLQGSFGFEAFPIGETRNYTGTLAESFVAGAVLSDPLILPPGSLLGGNTSNLSAATAFNAFIIADIVRIRL